MARTRGLCRGDGGAPAQQKPGRLARPPGPPAAELARPRIAQDLPRGRRAGRGLPRPSAPAGDAGDPRRPPDRRAGGLEVDLLPPLLTRDQTAASGAAPRTAMT